MIGVPRAGAIAAAFLAVLRAAPLVVQALGGGGLPAPGSYNDPAGALARIGASPDLVIVAGLICATGVVQVFVVLAFADWLRDRVPRVPGAPASDGIGLSVTFGVVSASFLMIDGALGMTALPQLAHMDAHSETVEAAYLATLGVRNGIDRVIPLTLGIWALTSHWPAWRHQSLPRSLAAAGLVLGAAGLAGAVVPPAGLVTLVLGVVWAAGFAVLQAVDGEVANRSSVA